MTAIVEGTPALVSDVGGMPATVAKNDAGWVMSDMTPEALRDDLNRILDKPKEIKEKKKVLKQNGHSEEDWKVIGESNGTDCF